MNTDETHLPGANDIEQELKINSEETRLPTADELNIKLNSIQGLHEGDCIGEGYIISAVSGNNGKQADIYNVKKFGKSFIAKLYKNGWQPSPKLQSFLKTFNHPNIVSLVENGFFNNNYFEIYEYYSEGTLEDKDIYSFSSLKNIIIPSINEGLHELHKNGIVHCDIKPSNLFFADNGKRVVIGDLGLSDYINSNGKYINMMRGTPEYAPPVVALFETATMSPAYDYGAFGLVICRLALGYSLLGGMSIEEIAFMWDKGIELPGSINVKLRELISGLINKNENDRWGYKEVKRWCEGEFLNGTVRKTRLPNRRDNHSNRLIFGKFDDELIVVESLHQLAVAIRNNWEQAKVVVKRRELTDFIKRIDLSLAQKVNELTYLYSDDEAVFRLLYLIENTNKIFYKGKDYGSLLEYINCLSSLADKNAIEFASSGLLVYYLKIRNADTRAIKKIEQLVKSSKGDDLIAIKSICYSIDNNSGLTLGDLEMSSLNEFISAIKKMPMSEIVSYIKRDDVIAWLYSMGLGNSVFKIKDL